jgi:hypothetical protein
MRQIFEVKIDFKAKVLAGSEEAALELVLEHCLDQVPLSCFLSRAGKAEVKLIEDVSEHVFDPNNPISGGGPM